MDFMSNHEAKYYFHNLKFDGAFIVDYLLRNGFKHTTGKSLYINTFSTLISDMGAWYSIAICFDNGTEVRIIDSLKLITMKIEDMPKTFGLSEKKLDLDYTSEREIGHVLTEHEKAYLGNDVIILAKSLAYMINGQGLTKLTTASNALYDFKQRYGPKAYKRDFGDDTMSLITDDFIRRSYKGGFTYLNPIYRNKAVGEGCVYDVNSMYPWAMKYCLLPYDRPVWFRGEYKDEPEYPLYVQRLLCEFKVKPGYIPTIQIKNSIYADNEYLEYSVEPTFLTLTNVDLELFFEHYDVNVIEFTDGYMFKAKHGIFDEYIDYWYHIKEESARQGNKGMKHTAKLFLNSLYGKFGARRSGCSKIPYLDDETDKVKYKLTEEEPRTGGYLPIATFITSYARDKIIRAAQKCGKRFIYADTDSLHVNGLEPVPGIDVDDFRLGAFKIEERFKRAKFIRQKTYLEIFENDGKEEMNIKCAGMPQNIKDTVKEEDFVEGQEFYGKLMPTIVPGGVILKETTFKIKEIHYS